MKNPIVQERFGEATPERLLGEINLLKDGVYISDIDCGYKSEMIPFIRNSGMSRKAMLRDDYLVPLVVPQSDHFQHFIDGVLPKLVQVLDMVRGSPKVKLLLRSSDDKIVEDILQAMGITPKMVSFYGYGYVRSRLQINTCITPPMHPALYMRARKMMAVPDRSHSPAKPHVLLIVRDKRHRSREFLNKQDVENYLKDRYDKRLKVISTPGSLEQVRSVFGNAAIVIGIHGGAFYNMLFAPRDTSIIEIVPTLESGLTRPSGLSVTIFWELASAIGQNYWRILETPQSHLGDLHVDVPKLSRVLDKVDRLHGF